MPDIPIGSPPVPPGRHAAPGGWYPDPVDPANERYWDGWQWSRNTRMREAATPGVPAPDARTGGRPARPAQPGGRAVTTADGVRLAGYGYRVLALFIDSALLSVVRALALGTIYLKLYEYASAWFTTVYSNAQAGKTTVTPFVSPLSNTENLTIILVSSGLQVIYLMAFWRWKGATPGKLALGLRVVPVDRGRSTEPLSWRSILIRTAVWVLPGAIAWLMLIRVFDVLNPLWHPKRQALHDIAAGTQVVRPHNLPDKD